MLLMEYHLTIPTKVTQDSGVVQTLATGYLPLTLMIIASIQVLKGVAASALYGYRGGNGAILITTKSGMKSKGVGVEVNDNFTVNNVIDLRGLPI
jgi:TonB-dependent SusC/RagA subfamily outer membrane receptor